MLIDEDSIATMQESLSAEEFAREHLGIPEAPDGVGESSIPLDVWEMLTDANSMAEEGTVYLSLDVEPSGKFSTFGIAGVRPDGLRHVAVRDRRPSTDWVVPRAVELSHGHGAPITIGAGSPAEAFVDPLIAAGVEVDVMTLKDYAGACGRLMDGCRGEQPVLRHRGDPTLRHSLAGAVSRVRGDGGVVWSRRDTKADLSPLVAVTLAYGRLDTLHENPWYEGGFTALDDLAEDDPNDWEWDDE